MVTKVFNIQPFFISIICDLNVVNRNSFFRVLSLSFSNSRSWCHVLQEKIMSVLLISIHLSLFKTKTKDGFIVILN